MARRRLGRTGTKVSSVCLGTMTWGEQNSEVDAHARRGLAVTLGVDIIDAAEMYPVPPRAGTQGRTGAALDASLRRLRTDYVDL